jgi:hypothetical protein
VRDDDGQEESSEIRVLFFDPQQRILPPGLDVTTRYSSLYNCFFFNFIPLPIYLLFVNVVSVH